MEHTRTEVVLLGRAAVGSTVSQHGSTSEDAGFPAWSWSASAQSEEPGSMFALIFVCVLI